MAPTLMIVDDEPMLLDLLVEEFNSVFEVLAASSYDEAVAFFDGMPDICAVVTDWRLGPGPDGIDLLKEIRERRPDIPRIMVSGHIGDFLTEVVVNTGIAHSCIRKPWDFGSLLPLVERLLETPEELLIYGEVPPLSA